MGNLKKRPCTAEGIWVYLAILVNYSLNGYLLPSLFSRQGVDSCIVLFCYS